MLEQFISHIRGKNLLDTGKQYLLAISGGMDSVCLAHLLRQSGVPFVMGHCNFGLRGKESDGDELFVRSLASELGVDIEVKHFKTKEYAESLGISTQMAARDLRYEWFDEVMKARGCEGIVVAHHHNDQLETILLNLMRGTGVEGVYGMSEIRDQVIRPLLPFSREELSKYAAESGITWREDSSNRESDYKRNFLRNEVLPLLKQQDSQVEEKLHQSFERLKDTGRAFFHLYSHWKKEHVGRDGEMAYLKKEDLQHLPGCKSFLYYWLRDYGFNPSQIDDMLAVLESGEVGRRFDAEGYMVNIDRSYIYLGKAKSDFREVSVSKNDVELQCGEESYDIMVLEEGNELDRSSKNAMLDRGALKFPLSLRYWQEGDRFRPLGMKKFKKISDFLIDLKVPVIAKKEVKVLCDDEGEVVWVQGFRVDDRFKVSAATKEIMYIKLK
ncbi:tRNA lysidine(34) synthetase TilS [Echinicola sediminis]